MFKTRNTQAPANNAFYRNHYHKLIIGLIAAIASMLGMIGVLLYQVHHRPIPKFDAVTAHAQRLTLVPNEEPNLLSSTLIKWASKAAVAAYTFDFVNYNAQLDLARPYFTDAGWNSYLNSIKGVLSTIVQNQLFVNGVVAGTPVISNQGVLPGRGYVWRIQMPFLVSYQSAETSTSNSYMVSLTIVRVPTSKNPAAIGVDQFVMK